MKKAITELNEKEISQLPDKFLVVTRTPGVSWYSPVFKLINKEALNKPDACVRVSGWGYARGRDIFLADKQEVEEYYAGLINQLKKDMENYKRYAF